jgi:hypothetical protein
MKSQAFFSRTQAAARVGRSYPWLQAKIAKGEVTPNEHGLIAAADVDRLLREQEIRSQCDGRVTAPSAIA